MSLLMKREILFSCNTNC